MTLSWAFDDQATPLSIYVLNLLEDTHALVPTLWAFEVTNVLSIAERQGRISVAQQAAFLERLRLLPIAIEYRPATWLAQQILPLARQYKLSAARHT
jgi:predicted nucleic acid-binding protein